MPLLQPKLVALDTSTWGNLARDADRDPAARRVLEFFGEGTVMPFLTYHHIEELFAHANARVRQSRAQLLRSLPWVAFMRLPAPAAYVGSILNLREAEIEVLLRQPTASIAEVIAAVRPRVTDGFVCGEDFYVHNHEWWELYSERFAEYVRAQSVEVSNVTHFPHGDMRERLPPVGATGYELRDPSELPAQFEIVASKLAERLRARGDARGRDPEVVAREFMHETLGEARAVYRMEGDPIDRVLRLHGVERARLPADATGEDVGYEAVFCAQHAVYERRQRLPTGTLREALRQDMMPSWLVWRELDRATKRLPRAEGGNVNDRLMAAFAPYVDAMEVDKRVLDCARQAIGRHPLLGAVYPKFFRRRSHADTVAKLEEIAERS